MKRPAAGWHSSGHAAQPFAAFRNDFSSSSFQARNHRLKTEVCTESRETAMIPVGRRCLVPSTMMDPHSGRMQHALISDRDLALLFRVAARSRLTGARIDPRFTGANLWDSS